MRTLDTWAQPLTACAESVCAIVPRSNDRHQATRAPWTSPQVTTQVSDWHELFTKGCVNSDALTDTSNVGQFVSGKAAMVTGDGSWDVGQYTQQMGSDVGAFVPPYSNSPQHGVVYFPGDAISVLS